MVAAAAAACVCLPRPVLGTSGPLRDAPPPPSGGGRCLWLTALLPG